MKLFNLHQYRRSILEAILLFHDVKNRQNQKIKKIVLYRVTQKFVKHYKY